MTILVCGGSGLVGNEMLCLLERKNINYITTYNTRKTKNGARLDFTSINEIREFLYKSNITDSKIERKQFNYSRLYINVCQP